MPVGDPSESKDHLHIKVAVCVPFESKTLRGAARIFLRGGAEVMEAKGL